MKREKGGRKEERKSEVEEIRESAANKKEEIGAKIRKAGKRKGRGKDEKLR